MCLQTGSSVLLRPCPHCFLTGPASAWSFVLPFCPPELGWFTFFLCSFMRFMYFHQYQMSSARILTGAPSAGGMTPLHREIPLQSQTRDLSLFFSFSLHVLLPKKGMTLIKKCTLSIKIGMCLSPVACYHSETYLSSVPHFKAAWILQGSFIDFTGFGTSWPWCCMWKWWSPELWRVMLWVSSPLSQNQLYLSACVLLDDHSFSYQILLSMTSAWARRLGKTQISAA